MYLESCFDALFLSTITASFIILPLYFVKVNRFFDFFEIFSVFIKGSNLLLNNWFVSVN